MRSAKASADGESLSDRPARHGRYKGNIVPLTNVQVTPTAATRPERSDRTFRETRLPSRVASNHKKRPRPRSRPTSSRGNREDERTAVRPTPPGGSPHRG